jgi:hypothetical protein
MDTATPQAVPKTYIADYIKLDFFNNSNLKNDIQNRISVNIEKNFINALHEMQGDNKSGFGISFSEITRLAMAYFYSEIFTDEIKNSYYTLEMVKGFLDANNLTNYTAIHEIDVRFYKLKETQYFKHCWLIIQSAWFFNSKYFGHHQHIDYVNNYINTGQKLPIENYNFDRIYLNKKYNDIDKAKTKKIPINGYTLVNHWYYGILFLICKELQLPTTHFNISIKDYREYNPLPKTSRQLRPLAPFKLIECDIKSAFPTFLDFEIGANLKDYVYNNLMLSKGITRGEAKVLFNKICNSGKYKSKEFTKQFFIDCGYSETQSEDLLYFTHNEKYKFISFMTEQEQDVINKFCILNNLNRGARLHDAIILIDDKVKPSILKVQPNCDFGLKELNRPIIKQSFSLDNKFLPYAFINSIPKGFNLITKREPVKPNIKGRANGFVFYTQKFKHITANFNLNNYFELINSEVEPFEVFTNQLNDMLSTLFYLNNRKLKPLELELILKHIREHGNYIFNVRALYLKLIKYDCCGYIKIKERDFDIVENLKFKKAIDFLKAMNEAIKVVNYQININNVLALIEERIYNNDYEYLTEQIQFAGRKEHNLLIRAIIRKFNLLCTGLNRNQRKRVKSNPLYITSIKSVTLKAISLKPQQQNAFLKKKINTYEIELKNYNRLINNRTIAQQLFLILCDITGAKNNLKILKSIEIQNKLKHELIQDILKIELNNIDAGVNCFNYLYKKQTTIEVKPIKDLTDNFDTNLNNSLFNQLSIEEANNRGETFFKEYLKFIKIVEVKELKPLTKKQVYHLPELDFDFL